MIELLFPPQWTPTQPYLGMACLAGYVREKGLKIRQRDVNALFYDHVLSKPFLEECREIVQLKFETLEKEVNVGKEYKELVIPFMISDIVVDSVEKAKKDFKSEKSLDVHEYLSNFKTIQNALLLISGAYSISLSLFDLTMGNLRSSRDVFSSVENPENLFLKIYEEILSFPSKNITLCGISITGIAQIIPGLTLARYVKMRDPSAMVVLGGSIITRWMDSPALKRIFELCDCIVVKEGEKALAGLATERVENVPNVWYERDGKIISNNVEVIQSLDALPTPCFDGLDMRLYFSPEPVLPVYASRACYWGRCAFCDHGHGYSKEYRVRSPERVVEDLTLLSRRFKTRYFSFADEAIPPGYFKKFCPLVVESGLDVRWLANVRAERGFEKKLSGQLYEAGCRILLFGIESGCQRVLDLMDKGTTIENAREVLKACKEAGLWNHAFLFFGFPGEKSEEAAETIRFVCENKEIIDSVGCSTFGLGNYSRVYLERDQFPDVTVQKEEDADMAIWYEYEVKNGITPKEAEDMCEVLRGRLVEIYGDQIYPRSICREHLLVLVGHGCDFAVKIPHILVDSNFRPRLSEDVSLKILQHDVVPVIEGNKEKADLRTVYVVYKVETERLMEVTKTAFDILQWCTGGYSVKEIAEMLSRKYGVDSDTGLRDTIGFLEEMGSKDIIYP